MELRNDKVILKPINLELDLELLLAWRNNLNDMHFFREQRSVLLWEEHTFFWNSVSNRLDWLILYDGRRVGHLALKKIDSNEPEIGILIGEQGLRGQGIAKESISLLISNDYIKCFESIHAIIHKENIASISLFKKLNFRLVSELKSDKNWLSLKYRVCN